MIGFGHCAFFVFFGESDLAGSGFGGSVLAGSAFGGSIDDQMIANDP